MLPPTSRLTSKESVDHQKKQELYESYSLALNELTFNSKPVINKLTLQAESQCQNSPVIARAIQDYWFKVPATMKLSVLYLIDSISKNLPRQLGYIDAFSLLLPRAFPQMFEQVDGDTRSKFLKVLQTWQSIYPPNVIAGIEAAIFRPQGSFPCAPPASFHAPFPLGPPGYYQGYPEAPLYPNVQSSSQLHQNTRRRSYNQGDGGPVAKISRLGLSELSTNHETNFLNDIEAFLSAEHVKSNRNSMINKGAYPAEERVMLELPVVEMTYAAISSLIPNDFYYVYDFYPLQCNNCGMRYPDSSSGRSQLDFHLDCHFKKARRLKDRVKKTLSRDWFLSEKDWLLNFTDSNDVSAEKETIDTFLDTSVPQNNVKPTFEKIPAKEGHPGTCFICGDLLEKEWDADLDEFIWKDATFEAKDKKEIVHTVCKE